MDAKVEGRIFALIPAQGGAGVYAGAGSSGWYLPSFETAARTLTDSVINIVEQEASAALGLDLHFLSCPAINRPAGDEPYIAAAIFENLEHDLPDDSALQLLSTADAVRLLPPDHAALVRTTLAEWTSADFPKLRVPWSRPGWLAEASTWIDSALAARGLKLTRRVDLRRSWSLSCLLHGTTTGGDIYFKAVPDLFAVEPALTRYLADAFPGEVPAVLGTDPRHWLLMRAFAGQPLIELHDHHIWTAALRRYAEMQVALADHHADLTLLGCPQRPLSALATHTRTVLADADALQIDQPRGLAGADFRALLDLLPAIDQICDEYSTFGLPNTLEHGDLHAHNIAVCPDGGFVFYDWTDGCLAPPLICLAPYLEVAPPAMHSALCAAYLEPWRAFASASQLERCLRLARALSPLHLAFSYYNIRLATEPRQHWELAGALAYFLREALAHIRLLDAQ